MVTFHWPQPAHWKPEFTESMLPHGTPRKFRSGGKRPKRTRNMTIELSKQARADAIASIQRYFQENMPESIGNIRAGLLLNFFVEEVGPANLQASHR